jgi:D-beta-D-heptose 7-phosphate kinase/D-beta-D-heptose 1-phosphate adenosyltransferase
VNLSGLEPLDAAGRILEREEAVRRYGPSRSQKLVFTNGCFDIVHRGHLSLLARARALGDALLVGLNSDASVRRLKGVGRPVLPEADRGLLLASLRFVDAVTLFDEDTPLQLIESLQPDILVKGADYRLEDVVGGDEVRARGGSVVLLPLEPDRSTSEFLRRLTNR